MLVGKDSDDSGIYGSIGPFTIDINATEYSKLKTKGEYIAMNGVIIAQTLEG